MPSTGNKRSLADLLALLEIEERARCCSTRAHAQLLIREADEVKRSLWGSQARSANTHF